MVCLQILQWPFLPRLAANKGTPLQPGYIEVYWLLDEDAKSTDLGNFERHWGIFRYDGQSQFAMVLLVQGQNKMLKGPRGVKYRVQGQNKMLVKICQKLLMYGKQARITNVSLKMKT